MPTRTRNFLHTSRVLRIHLCHMSPTNPIHFIRCVLVLACTTFVLAIGSTAQGNTPKDEIIEVQKVDSSGFFYFVVRTVKADTAQYPSSYFLLKFTEDGGTSFIEHPMTQVSEGMYGGSNEQIHISFVNRQLGFVFGHSMEYGFWPFVFRTADGGISWQRVAFEKGEYGTPLYYQHFFMFNERQGILLQNWSSPGKLHYLLTNDGGITWKKRSFKLRNTDMLVRNEGGGISAYYSADGIATVVIVQLDHDLRKNNRVAVVRSENFGADFHELK